MPSHYDENPAPQLRLGGPLADLPPVQAQQAQVVPEPQPAPPEIPAALPGLHAHPDVARAVYEGVRDLVAPLGVNIGPNRPSVPIPGSEREIDLMAFIDLMSNTIEPGAGTALKGLALKTGFPLAAFIGKRAEDVYTSGKRVFKGSGGPPREAVRPDALGRRRFMFEMAGDTNTGQGAQTFGHGLYFAENPAVAGDYVRTLGEPRVFVGGVEDTSSGVGSVAGLLRSRIKQHGNGYDIEDLRGELRRAVGSAGESRYPEESRAKNLLAELDRMEREGIEIVPGGTLIEARIDVADDEWLDWDVELPDDKINMLLNAPNDTVRRTIERSLRAAAEGEPHRLTGGGFVRDLERRFWDETVDRSEGSAQKWASEALREAGIPGIRYLDQGSRKTDVAGRATGGWKVTYENGNTAVMNNRPSPGPGIVSIEPNTEGVTRNIVLFDDSRVRALKMNGEPIITDVGAPGMGEAVKARPGSAFPTPGTLAETTDNPRSFVGPYELPEEFDERGLFHVTTNLPEVRASGLKSRRQVRSTSGGQMGLGGGIDDVSPSTVSVTYSEQRAHEIESALLLASDVAHGKATPMQVVDAMEQRYNVEISQLPEVEEMLRRFGLPVPDAAPFDDDWVDVYELLHDADWTPEETFDFMVALDDWMNSGLTMDEYSVGLPRVGITAGFEQAKRLDRDKIGIVDVLADKRAHPEHIVEEAELRFQPEDVRLMYRGSRRFSGDPKAARPGSAFKGEAAAKPVFVERGFGGGKDFDELPDNTDVWVFHSTDDATADLFLRSGVDPSAKPDTIGGRMAAAGEADFAPGRGAGRGLYVGGNPDDIPHARRMLAIKVKKSDLGVSPESAALGFTTPGGALNSQGAVVESAIQPSQIVDVTVPGKSHNTSDAKRILK